MAIGAAIKRGTGSASRRGGEPITGPGVIVAVETAGREHAGADAGAGRCPDEIQSTLRRDAYQQNLFRQASFIKTSVDNTIAAHATAASWSYRRTCVPGKLVQHHHAGIRFHWWWRSPLKAFIQHQHDDRRHGHRYRRWWTMRSSTWRNIVRRLRENGHRSHADHQLRLSIGRVRSGLRSSCHAHYSARLCLSSKRRRGRLLQPLGLAFVVSWPLRRGATLTPP